MPPCSSDLGRTFTRASSADTRCTRGNGGGDSGVAISMAGHRIYKHGHLSMECLLDRRARAHTFRRATTVIRYFQFRQVLSFSLSPFLFFFVLGNCETTNKKEGNVNFFSLFRIPDLSYGDDRSFTSLVSLLFCLRIFVYLSSLLDPLLVRSSYSDHSQFYWSVNR